MGKFLKKIMTKEVMFYIILGVCTTLVNLISFQLLTKACKLNDNLSNAIAIILSVLFAYITNKDIVGGLLMFKLPIDKMISKIILTFVVIVLNFFISKFFAFKKKK